VVDFKTTISHKDAKLAKKAFLSLIFSACSASLREMGLGFSLAAFAALREMLLKKSYFTQRRRVRRERQENTFTQRREARNEDSCIFGLPCVK
jgi:hypothetical protein